MTTWKQIAEIAQKCGAKFPDLVAAQWALESNRGQALSGKNNFFGIKGKGTIKETKEFEDGKWTTVIAEFKDFDSPEDCIQYLVDRWYKDYEDYKGVDNSLTREQAAFQLVQEGYATDPKYAEKLIALMREEVPQNISKISTKKVIGPTKKPQDFGFKPKDFHLIVNDISETAKAYNFKGELLWEVPCLARGQGSDFEFKIATTDTPPGLYRIGAVYRDYDRVGASPAYDRTLMAYGWYSFDLQELENQEAKYGRAGIMIHGGGSACGWPGAWAPMQPLYSTYGCVRMHNQHLREKLFPLTRTGTVYVSVYQEG